MGFFQETVNVLHLILVNVEVVGLDLAALFTTVISLTNVPTKGNVLGLMFVNVLEDMKGMIAVFIWIAHI